MTDIARLRVLGDEATPGPWTAGVPHGPAEWMIYDRDWLIASCNVYNDPEWNLTYPTDPRTYITADAANANAALIVELRNALPSLLAVVEAARTFADDFDYWTAPPTRGIDGNPVRLFKFGQTQPETERLAARLRAALDNLAKS